MTYRINKNFPMCVEENMTIKKYFKLISEKKSRQDFENDDDYKNYKHSTPIIFGFGVIIYILLLLLFAVLWDQNFPTVSLDEDRFSVSNAVKFNEELIKLGPKVVGSEANQIHVVNILENKIKEIINAKHPNQNIMYEKQMADGVYRLHGYNVIHVYRGVRNIIVKVNSDSSDTTLLVNSHYDSTVESPGGSDAGIMCSIMIEMLRILSQSATKQKHNIVFLFNGAEETMMQASHGFVTQHKWAKNITTVINLDASGVGEREMLFQSGPKQPWLLKYYSKVPYPHAQVSGEELFQSKIIPSDTDFRIFRDYGNMVGLDLAYTRNGYRYHTKYDTGDIDLHTYKHTGENVLSLIESLANAPELENIEEDHGNAVFYDFMGLFLVYYDRGGELAINLVASIATILCFAIYIYDYKLYKSPGNIKYIAISLCGLIIGIVLSFGFLLLIGVILDAADFTMRWYKSVWLVLGLYCAPIMAIQLISYILLNKYNKPESFTYGMQAQFQIQLNNLVFAIILLAGTIAEIRSVYMFLYQILFTTAAFIIILLTKKCTSYSWKYIYLVALFIPTLFIFQLAMEMILMFIPICGRNGGLQNPEFMIGLMCFLMCIIATSYYIPLIATMRNSLYVVYFLTLTFVIFLILTFTSVTYPYGIDGTIAPHRYSISHTSRMIRNSNNELIKQDFGFTFANSDRNSPTTIKDYVKEMDRSTTLEVDCKLTLYCGVATTDSRATKKLPKAIWIPSGKVAENNPKVVLVLKNMISTTEKLEYEFEITAPDRMNIYFAVHKGISISTLNGLGDIPKSLMEFDGMDVYFMTYIHGDDPVVPWTLNLKFDVNYDTTEYNFINIAVAGKYVHDFQKSHEFEQFLEQFPDWIALSPWVTTYESWTFK